MLIFEKKKMRLFLSLFVFFVGFFASAQQKDTCMTLTSSLSKANADKLVIACSCDLAEFSIQIYSRWGQLVYEAKTFMTPFDLDVNARSGKKNQEVQVFGEGTYLYKIHYRKYNTQEYIDATGYITIL
jgi:hypothetical protein